MTWEQIRGKYPARWLVVEALDACTDLYGNRIIGKFSVVEECNNSRVAYSTYRKLHKQYPFREYYYLHTSREAIDIKEQVWAGVRVGNEI